MVLLDGWVLTDILVRADGVYQAFLVVVLDIGDEQDDVAVTDGGNDDVEDADAHADALWIQVVADVGRGVEGVSVDLQLVVLLEGFHGLLVVGRGVGMREDAEHVADGIVDGIAVDTVVLLDALADVVHHLCFHLLFGGYGDEGNKHEDADEDE